MTDISPDSRGFNEAAPAGAAKGRMRSPSSLIWSRRGSIETAQRKKIEEAMDRYDREVYYPVMAALRAECEAIGHKPHPQFHDNGFGWTWQSCNQCGPRVNLEGPADCNEGASGASDRLANETPST